MKKPDPINKVRHSDEFSSGLMEQYGKWMGGDCFQNTEMPDLHLSEAPFDGMDPQSNGAELEKITTKKKGPKKESPKAQLATKEEYEVLEREEVEIDGEVYVLEKRRYATEGMAAARDNVGASTCWKGYKAKGTKKKGGKEVPNCVKEEEVAEHHQKDADGKVIEHDGEDLEEAKKGLYANIHAKRNRGEAPAKAGSEDYPAKDAFKKAAKTAKKEELELSEKKLDPVGKADADIDNDGDVDKSDKYLHARRKKVTKIISMTKKKK